MDLDLDSQWLYADPPESYKVYVFRADAASTPKPTSALSESVCLSKTILVEASLRMMGLYKQHSDAAKR